MKKKYKKIALPLLLTLGGIITPILLSTVLLSNSHSTSNKNTSLNRSENVPNPKTEFTRDMATTLIAKKKSNPDWNGSLIATDFESATSIAPNAFLRDSGIISVTLPKGLTKIGNNAFNGIASLLTIVAEDVITIGDGAFQYTKLSTVTFPNLTTLGKSAFKKVTTLTNISMPVATSIGDGAFEGINNATINLTWSANVNKEKIADWGPSTSRFIFASEPIPPTVGGIIDARLVNDLITYKEQIASQTSTNWNGTLLETDFTGATSVADGAFQNKANIISIILPTTVKIIGTNAFNAASGLTTISALGAKSIGNSAFNGATALTTINLLAAKSIGDGAFEGTTNIIPKGIKLTYSTNIKPSNATTWGTTVDKLSIEGTAPTKPTITDGIINKVYVDELIAYKNHESPSNDPWKGDLVAADFVNAKSVANGAFEGNTKVTSITLPMEVMNIGINAFSGATNLTIISALGATSIATNAFAHTDAIIPAGIKLTYSTNIKPSNFDIWGTNDFKLDIAGNLPTKPTITEGIINKVYVDQLISYKNYLLPSGTNWTGDLVAADFIDAKSVADGAFQNKANIISIILPTEVKKIGANAFAGITTLTTISALGATSIGTNAFARTTSTINLTWSADVNNTKATDWGTTIDKLSFIDAPTLPPIIDGVITPTFVNALITYKEQIASQTGTTWDGTLVAADFTDATSVADGSFQNKANIISIILPTEVKKIGANAFNGATNLTTISALGATSIGTNAFAGLEAITTGGIKLTNSSGVNISKAADWGIVGTNLNFVVVEDGLSSDLIIGMSAAIGGVALIALLAGGFIFYRKKVNNSKVDTNPKEIDMDSK